MILKSVDGQLGPTSFFKPVAIGYVCGAAVFFLPVLLLMTLMSVIMVATGSSAAPEADAANPLTHILMGFIMVPLILIMQSLMFGGLVVLGLSIYRLKRPIRIMNRTETASAAPPIPSPSPQSTD